MRNIFSPMMVTADKFFSVTSLISPMPTVNIGCSYSAYIADNLDGSPSRYTYSDTGMNTGITIRPSWMQFGNSITGADILSSNLLKNMPINNTHLYGALPFNDISANYIVNMGWFPPFMGGFSINPTHFHGDFIFSNVSSSRFAAEGTPVLNWTDLAPALMGETGRWRSFLGFPKSTNENENIFSTWDAIGSSFSGGVTTSIAKDGIVFEPSSGIPNMVTSVNSGNVFSIGFMNAGGASFPTIPGSVLAVIGDAATSDLAIVAATIPTSTGIMGSSLIDYASETNHINNINLRSPSRGYALNAFFGTGNHFVRLNLIGQTDDRIDSFLDWVVYDDFEYIAPNPPNPLVWDTLAAAGPCVITANPPWSPSVGLGNSLLIEDSDPNLGIANHIAHDFSNRDAYSLSDDKEKLYTTIFVGIDSTLSPADGAFYIEWWEDSTRAVLAYAVRFLVVAGAPVSIDIIQPGRVWLPIVPVTYQYPSGGSGPTFKFDEWYALQLEMDTSAQTVTLFINGVSVVVGDPFCEPTSEIGYYIMNTGDGIVDPAAASVIGAYVGFFLTSPVPHDLYTYHWPNDGPVPIPFVTPGTLNCMMTSIDLDSSTYDGTNAETVYAGYLTDGVANTLHAIDFRSPVASIGIWPLPIPKITSPVGLTLTDTVYDITSYNVFFNNYNDAKLLVGTEIGIFRFDFIGAAVAPTSTWDAAVIGADHRYVDIINSFQTPFLFFGGGGFDVEEESTAIGFVAGGDPGAGATILYFGYGGNPDEYYELTLGDDLLSDMLGTGTDTITGVASGVPSIGLIPVAGSLRGGGVFSNEGSMSWTKPAFSSSISAIDDYEMQLVGGSFNLNLIGTKYTRIDHLFGNVYAVGTDNMGVWLWLPSSSSQSGFPQLIPLILPISAAVLPEFNMFESAGIKAWPNITTDDPSKFYYEPLTDEWFVKNQLEEEGAIAHAGTVPFFTWVCHGLGSQVDGVAMTLTKIIYNTVVLTKTATGVGNLDFELYCQEPGGAPVLLHSGSSPDTDLSYLASFTGSKEAGTIFWIDVTAWPVLAGGITARVQFHGLVDSEIVP